MFSQIVCEQDSPHVLPKRVLSTADQDGRCNNDPQRGTEDEVKDHGGHPWRNEEDKRAYVDSHVHEHCHKQALGMVVDPHHEHPVGQEPREEEYSQVESRRQPGGTGASREEREVPRSPQQTHDEPGRKKTMPLSELENSEPRPAELL